MQLVKKVVLFFLVLFLFSSLTKNIIDYQSKLTFYNDFKTKFEEEKKRNITLKTELLKKSDPDEVEKTIRDRLNLSKENEQTIILPEATPTPTPYVTPSYPVWRQWINLFTDH